MNVFQILEDISGNTYVSNPHAPHKDVDCTTVQFVRSTTQDHALGIYASEGSIASTLPPTQFTIEDLEGEVLQFPTNCPNCAAPCKTNMKLTSILCFVFLVSNKITLQSGFNKFTVGRTVLTHRIAMLRLLGIWFQCCVYSEGQYF